MAYGVCVSVSPNVTVFAPRLCPAFYDMGERRGMVCGRGRLDLFEAVLPLIELEMSVSPVTRRSLW